MTEKKYAILISCIACILAFVLALCSVTVSHAEESELFDDNWSYWHVLDNDSTQNGKVDSFGKDVPWTNVEYPDISDFESNDIYHLETLDNTWSTELRAYTFACKDEVSGYVEQQSDGQYIIRIMCLSALTIKANVYNLAGKDSFSQTRTNLSYTNWKSSYTSAGDYYIYLDMIAYSTTRSGGIVYAINTLNIKFYDSVDHCYDHLKNGSDVGRIMDNTPKQTYSSELAFTSFDMSVHDSNSFDDYYLEFLYKCPEEWLGKNPKLVINQTWDYNIYYFDNKGTSSPLTVNGSNTCALSVSGDKNSIKISLGQLDCLKEFVSSSNNVLGASSEMKRRVLGSSFSSPPLGKVLTFNGLPIRADASYKVDKSFLSLSCVVYVDGVAGHEYAGSVDLISGDNSMASYTPDLDGNYTFNDDYKTGGRYYTDVGKDAAGNTTYNYYYYGTDGSKKDVSSEDAVNNTITNTVQEGAIKIDNNPTFSNNNNITIEGDTISNSASSYADSKSDATTNKSFIDKFLGFFEIIENNSFLGVFSKIFAWLPTGISSLVTTALGIIVGIRVFKAFH